MTTCSLDVLSRIAPPVRASLVELVERAAAAPPEVEPVVPRPAASVVVLRDGADGLQTYLLHRHARMAFAASMAVFPGGGVDPADRGAATAGDALTACAVRETAEETGVVLAPEELWPWAHWITPTPESRRYDTVFYVAALPPGQDAADLSTETDSAGWVRPIEALAQAAAGVISLMPPTESILTELADLPDLAAVRDAATDRLVVTVLPEVVRTSTGWAYRYPVAP